VTLRRLALSALLVFFFSAAVWGETPHPELRTGIWRGMKVTYQWTPGVNGNNRAVYQGDILLDNVQQSPDNHVSQSLGIAFPQYLWPKVGGVAQVPYVIDPASGDVANINAAIYFQ